MPSLLESLVDLPMNVGRDETISQLIQVAFSKRFFQDSRPEEYFFLTELCNPMHAYWARKRSDVQKSKELAARLNWGHVLQNRAYCWMRKMPEYVSEESNLVGDYVGVSKVVGKYDVKFGDSIVEFKSKPSNVTDVKTVLEDFPQDLEQICFYAALSPKTTRIHYLIFQLDHKPFDMNVFKVDIGDIGAIRNLMRQRVNQLDNALTTSNPSRLGKCRYYDTGCDYGSQQICPCATSEKASATLLQNAVSITVDIERKLQLEKCRDEYGLPESHSFRPWNLLMPRKHYMKCVIGHSDDYEERPEEIAYKDALHKALIRSTRLKPLPSELKGIRHCGMDLPIVPSWRYIAIQDPELGRQKRRVVPVLLKVNRSMKTSPRIPDSYKAEIAIAQVMSSKSTKGVVIVVYPKANDAIQTFVLSSQDDALASAEGLLRDAISTLSKAIDSRTIEQLDICPEWVRHGDCGNCPSACEALVGQRTS